MSTDSPKAFAALQVPAYRAYFVTGALSMMADSIEHAISYWIMFEKFQSPALGGFATLSHWLPFLFFSVYAGSLADRRDPRRMVQLGMLIFMGVSVAWGVLFLTDTLEQWHAMVLLTLHGLAGVLWGPPSQLLIHHLVGEKDLHSAVRLGATARVLGLVAGPAVGGLLMLALGPAWGILLNALIYLPMIIWLWKAPYTPPQAEAGSQSALAAAGTATKDRPARIRGFSDFRNALTEIRANPAILSMVALGGGASFFVAGGYHAQMPGFAHALGQTDADLSYSMLLAADAIGALVAGIVLEIRGTLRATPRNACLLMLAWCVVMMAFAMTPWYALALVLLFIAGFLELSAYAMSQTLVQVHAPPQSRGRIIGFFSMASGGLRAFSGISIGILGGFIGIHWSLGISAFALFLLVCFLLAHTSRASGTR